MTYQSLRRDQPSLDLLAADLLSECPDCHDYAHPTATCCESCGAHLFPSSHATGPARASHGRDSVQGQKEPIMASPAGCTCGGQNVCTVCTMAEYDSGPERAIAMTIAALERKPAELRTVEA